MSHVSRILNELQKAGLVECLTPEEKIGRFYGITEREEDIRAQISQDSF